MSASMEASATACAGSAAEPRAASSTAAIIGPSDESGPSTRIRDGPKTAYASRQKIEVYSPVIGGRLSQFGVRHALWHQQGRQDDAGDGVARQPGGPVVRDDLDAGYPAGDASGRFVVRRRVPGGRSGGVFPVRHVALHGSRTPSELQTAAPGLIPRE
nr:hypothetical protein GCM10020092_065750 [Actinoplanes digitatis]